MTSEAKRQTAPKRSSTLDFNENYMRDFGICKWSIRIFWRGVPWTLWHPYGFHKWGFYGFGAWQIGFMVWPPNEAGRTR